MGLKGHDELVNVVKFTPNDRLVISGSEDRTVRVWNVSTGSCVRIIRGHTSMVRTVAVMPDGNRVVSAGTDGTIRLWDIETGTNLAVVGGRLGHVSSLVALPDGRSIVSGDFDRNVKLWDLSASTSFISKIGANVHPAEVRSLAVFPGSSQIAVGYICNEECSEIRVWDAGQSRIGTNGHHSHHHHKETRPPLWSVEGHNDTVCALSIINGDGLASAGFDRTVRVWDPSSATPSEPTLIINSGETVPLALAAWPDGRGLAYGCDDGSMHIWDLARRREALSDPQRHENGVRGADISSGALLVSSGADKAVRLLRLEDTVQQSIAP